MPIYLNAKQDLSIPQEFDSDDSENENYLNDPDMLFDKLPQPFQFINKLLNKILNEAYSIIHDNFNRKLLEISKVPIRETFPVTLLKDSQTIQCLVNVSEDSNYLIAGLNSGLAVLDLMNQQFIDKWDNVEMNIASIQCKQLCEDIFILTTIDYNGSANLIALVQNRFYMIKQFPSNKDSEKPFQITAIYLDENCGYVSLSYDQFKENEQWVEVYKISKEVWIKELSSTSKALQEYFASQIENQTTGVELGQDESSILDRNGVKVTGINIVFKFKFPDSLGSTGINNFTQIFKQIDTMGHTIGIGLNHCMSAEFVEKLNNSYQNDYPDFFDPTSETELPLLRTANIQYSRLSGSMIRDTLQTGTSESTLIFVWWTQSQHLLIYGLNRPVQKSPNDGFCKPDAIRSFSTHIVACELSSNKLNLGVGLDNGIFILIDILSGITRTVKQISDCPLKSIYPLNFENDCQETKLINGVPFKNLAYFSIIDDHYQMYCLKYDSETLPNDATFTIISNEADTDSICRINRSDLALSIYNKDFAFLQDLVSGVKILRIQLPENSNLINSWQPIFGFSSNTGYLCLQIKSNPSEEAENVESIEQSAAIYKTELENEPNESNENCNKIKPFAFENCSFINYTIANILSERYKNHEERQKLLQDSWENLDEILKTLS